MQFVFFFFFFNDTATTEIYTLSLHDALPIFHRGAPGAARRAQVDRAVGLQCAGLEGLARQVLQLRRSEEHTSELQSLAYLVCRLLLEKKKKESVVGDICVEELNSRNRLGAD